MSVVVMPTLHRPEFLALSLERLRAANNRPDDIRIYLDHTTEEKLQEVEFVRDQYFPEAMIFHATAHIDVPSGMWNILNALLKGYETGANHVYLIEEDVMVYPDFFNWHEQAQKTGMWFATCGRISPRYPNYKFYQNPGSCFERSMLELVVRHIHYDMFKDRRAYMDQTFGKMEESSDLDDGLIRRVARQHGLQVLYPETPKCAHQGFRAYNRFVEYKNEGSIEQRISNLRVMLPGLDLNGRYTRDFEPFAP